MMKRFKQLLLVLALALGWALGSGPLPMARAAGPWYVAPGSDDGNDCLSPGSACATINEAIAKASPGDTIYVAIGTYTHTWRSEVVLLDKSVTLSGGWDGTFTAQSGTSTIDGEGAYSRRGITMYGGVTAIVERFTIQNGASDQGGGIYNYGTLILNNSTVSGNTAGDGGGINNIGGTATLQNSIVAGNTAGNSGGGIYSYGMTLNNSTVSGNVDSH